LGSKTINTRACGWPAAQQVLHHKPVECYKEVGGPAARKHTNYLECIQHSSTKSCRHGISPYADVWPRTPILKRVGMQTHIASSHIRKLRQCKKSYSQARACTHATSCMQACSPECMQPCCIHALTCPQTCMLLHAHDLRLTNTFEYLPGAIVQAEALHAVHGEHAIGAHQSP
jgi:hypothetical protein